MAYYFKRTSTENKKRMLKARREKNQTAHENKLIKITADI
jgi:hypothetical protein